MPVTETQSPAWENALQALSAYGVVLPKPDEVRAYLERFADLALLLSDFGKAAREEFGDRAELSLEVYTDPEIQDRYLTLYIRQQTYDPDLLSRIEQVQEAHEDRLAGASGPLLLTTDFRPPRRPHAV